MELTYLVWPLAIAFVVVKVLFDLGRGFQRANDWVSKLRYAKAEDKRQATANKVDKPAEAKAEVEVPSDSATQALNADPHVVIPFKGGPAPKGIEQLMAASDEEVAVEASNEVSEDATQAVAETDWASYDEPAVLRRNPSWQPQFVTPPKPESLESALVSIATTDQHAWEDYAAMMRTENGGLMPLLDASMEPLVQH